MKKIYIAGPMRGRPEWNYTAFMEAEARWQEWGWHVFNPHVLVEALGYSKSEDCEPHNDVEHLRHVLLQDISCILASDAIALLPDWKLSRGATFELAVAQFLDLIIYDAVTGIALDPEMTPWKFLY